MDFKKIREELMKFREDRNWGQFHNPKDLSTAIAIEASELQEKFLWKSQEESYEIGQTDAEVHEEFADILSFMIIFAEECNINIEEIIFKKIEKNSKKYPVEKSKGSSLKYDKI